MLKSIYLTGGGSMMYLAVQGLSPDGSTLLLTKVDGLGPMKADLSVMDTAAYDGGLYVGRRIGARNIVLSITYSSWFGDVEQHRAQLYKVAMPGEPIRLELDTAFGRKIIDGVVETHEPDIFSAEASAVISIICPQPYYTGVDPQPSKIGAAGTPLSINYAGDHPSGIDFHFYKSPTVTQIVLDVLPPKVEYNTKMVFNLSGTYMNQNIFMSSKQGKKRVNTWTYNPEIGTNALGTLAQGYTWPKLYPGLNVVRVTTTPPTSGTIKVGYSDYFKAL